MKLNQKILLMIGGLVLVSLILMSTIVSIIQRDTTKEIIVAELEERRDGAREGFQNYLDAIDQDLNLWASLPLTQGAFVGFSDAWGQIGQDPMSKLQGLYITDNPNATGEKDKLAFASDGSAYSAAHREYHPSYNALKDERGYYDVFLIDPDGNII